MANSIWAKYDKVQALEYLALLQIDPEYSALTLHIMELQANIAKYGGSYNEFNIDNFINDIQGYEYHSAEESQENLFVENIITPLGQFKLFTTTVNDEHYHIERLLNYAYVSKLFDYADFLKVHILLHISDKIAQRCNLKYYEKGENENVQFKPNSHFYTLQISRICFSTGDFLAFEPKSKLTAELLNDYILDLNDINLSSQIDRFNPIEEKPILKKDDEWIILSPASLVICAWRELLKTFKLKTSDIEIHNVLLQQIVDEAEKKFVALHYKRLGKYTSDNKYGTQHVYEIYFHRYMIVSFLYCNTSEISIVDLHPDEPDYIPSEQITNNIKLIYNRIQQDDYEASVFVVNIPICLQKGVCSAFEDIGIPVIGIKWDALKILLDRKSGNRLWLYYYAIDRSDSSVSIMPLSQEEDCITMYINNGYTFYYCDDDSPENQLIVISSGVFLSLKFEELNKQNIHIVRCDDLRYILTHDGDTPLQIPFYYCGTKDNLLFGEFMLACILFSFDVDRAVEYVIYRSIAKSITVWMYAIELKTKRPLFNRHLRLNIKFDIQHLIEFNDGVYCQIARTENPITANLYLSTEIFEDGFKLANKLEKQIILSILDYYDRVGAVINPDYKNVVNNIFSECNGRYLLITSDYDPIADTSFGNQESYEIDRRWNDIILRQLATDFKNVGPRSLSFEESKTLVVSIISYLNRRITSALEQFNQRDLLQKLYELYDGLLFWHHTMFTRFFEIQKVNQYLGFVDEEQAQLINENIECNLVTRCLIEYTVIKCRNFGNNQIDAERVDEIYSLMRLLIVVGALNDYYKLPAISHPISILGSGRFAFPVNVYDKGNEYTNFVNQDRLWHPNIYKKMSELIPQITTDNCQMEYDHAFKSEFGVSLTQYEDITRVIVEYISKVHHHIVLMPMAELIYYIYNETNITETIIRNYFNVFSISSAYHDLSLLPMFKEHDLFPCRYKRKLSVISRPFSVFNIESVNYVIFSFRGLFQSYIQFEDNIIKSKYKPVSQEMSSFQGMLNRVRGKSFEDNLYDIFKSMPEIIAYKSVAIAPGKQLDNDQNLGDIDILLINNTSKCILCIEAKNYNKGKTAYEMVDLHMKIKNDLKKIRKRDVWCKEHIDAFKDLARSNISNYNISTICVTYHKNAAEYLDDGIQEGISFVWVRDFIEYPLSIFSKTYPQK